MVLDHHGLLRAQVEDADQPIAGAHRNVQPGVIKAQSRQVMTWVWYGVSHMCG